MSWKTNTQRSVNSTKRRSTVSKLNSQRSRLPTLIHRRLEAANINPPTAVPITSLPIHPIPHMPLHTLLLILITPPARKEQVVAVVQIPILTLCRLMTDQTENGIVTGTGISERNRGIAKEISIGIGEISQGVRNLWLPPRVEVSRGNVSDLRIFLHRNPSFRLRANSASSFVFPPLSFIGPFHQSHNILGRWDCQFCLYHTNMDLPFFFLCSDGCATLSSHIII